MGESGTNNILISVPPEGHNFRAGLPGLTPAGNGIIQNPWISLPLLAF